MIDPSKYATNLKIPQSCWDCTIADGVPGCPVFMVGGASEYKDRRHPNCPIKAEEMPYPVKLHNRRLTQDEELQRQLLLDIQEKLRKRTYKKPRKEPVNLKAIEKAYNDQRLDIWMDFDGDIHIKTVSTGNEIIITPRRDLQGRLEDEM